MRRRFMIAAMVAVLLSAATILSPALAEVFEPTSLRALIDARYPRGRWIDTETLASWMAHPQARGLVLLDVREPEEFAVSHLSRARRVDPDLRDMARLGIPTAATIVVYCSVGYRSGEMASRLEAAGYRQVRNLEGGIFQWANEGRPLFQGTRAVSLVHPYDQSWGRYLLERHRWSR